VQDDAQQQGEGELHRNNSSHSDSLYFPP
jgi:hypothetical protein